MTLNNNNNNNNNQLPDLDLECDTYYSNLFSSLPFDSIDRFNSLSSKLNLSHIQTLQFLIDFYYIDSYKDVQTMRERIKERIRGGVNKDFLISLKGLYVFLGHFLQSIRYLK